MWVPCRLVVLDHLAKIGYAIAEVGAGPGGARQCGYRAIGRQRPGTGDGEPGARQVKRAPVTGEVVAQQKSARVDPVFKCPGISTPGQEAFYVIHVSGASV